jgi:uncharacterized protein
MACFNKEIHRFKLAINSGCPLRCDYCFLDKDAGEVLPLALAREAVDMVLTTAGRAKKLLIYGGEPFLEFELLRAIVAHVRRRELELGKQVAVSVATSAAAFRRPQLEFLRDQRVQLAISVDGGAESHDRFRKMKSGKGSFELVRKNLRLAAEIMPKENMVALLGVHPTNAARFFQNFKYLVSLGFDTVNIEVIHGAPWSSQRVEQFERGLEDIRSLIAESFARREFLFLESSYRSFLSEEPPSGPGFCPFFRSLEVYPNGDYSFYPFPFVTRPDERPRVRVGSVKDGFVARYRDCSLDAAAPLCQGCTGDYFTIKRLESGTHAYRLRNLASRGLAQDMRRAHGNTSLYREYVDAVNVRDNLGFSQ